MKQSIYVSDINPKYEHLVKFIKKKLIHIILKYKKSDYLDLGFDLLIPYDYTEYVNGYTENHISYLTFHALLA